METIPALIKRWQELAIEFDDLELHIRPYCEGGWMAAWVEDGCSLWGEEHFVDTFEGGMIWLESEMDKERKQRAWEQAQEGGS